MDELEQYVGQSYREEIIGVLADWAKAKELVINIIPNTAENTDADSKRLNIWVDFNSRTITQFTVG